MGDWTFFSNYGHVLVCLARNRDARLRDVAREVGITERAVQKIVRDLQESGYLEITKKGRCNRYRINRRKSLRHPLQTQCTVGKLLALLTREDFSAEAGQAAAPAEAAAPGPAASAPEPVTVPPAATRPTEPGATQAAESESHPIEESETDSKTAGTDEPEPERSAKRKTRPSPADSREQGSLF
jgi:biotin operon repressor